jgi:uncharacterized 2Fe-2S/4Fe-4S cluster protein (DUF4445 family)
MRAEPGAIRRIEGVGSRRRVVDVIGGGEPKGLCGSGLTDLIAGLVGAGLLDRKGNFTRGGDKEGFRFLPGRRDLVLKKRDVDVFQRAKAAIGAAAACLMERAGARPEDLRRVCVCGDFGGCLDVGNAQSLGLLPETETGRVELCGNTALAGCETMLLSPGTRAPGAQKAKVLNMTGEKAFEERFFENLLLRPIRIRETPKRRRPGETAGPDPVGRAAGTETTYGSS